MLLGARQVGRSTLLSSLEPDLSLNLASLATFRELVAEPERLERELLAARAGVHRADRRGPTRPRAPRRRSGHRRRAPAALQVPAVRVEREEASTWTREPAAWTHVMFLGARRQRLDAVEIIPLEEFLAELPKTP